jgi:hypothetical protein
MWEVTRICWGIRALVLHPEKCLCQLDNLLKLLFILVIGCFVWLKNIGAMYQSGKTLGVEDE